jgi:lincosamide nucleotidyltransferase A/C/D/E
MGSGQVIAILDLLERASIEVWLDGGWGVDALLGHPSRPHKDIDLVVRVSDVPRMMDTLAAEGFVLHDGQIPQSFVLEDTEGLQIDVHSIVFDEVGNGVYRMQNGVDWIYPAEGFKGRGFVGDRPVQCLSATTQVLCHADGYEPAEKDIQDMELLRQKYGVQLPPSLRRDPPS